MISKYWPWALIFLLLTSCASVKAPEGGPKDATQPRLTGSLPASHNTFFAAKSILLEFSEEVVENNPKQYLISPVTPVTLLDGAKRIKIIPDSGFKPSTTYTLQLHRKIKDTKEGNLLRDTTITFSTGRYLDSLRLDATIKNLNNETNLITHIVTLQDSKRHTYFGLSDSTGKVSIPNIPGGKYYLECYTDKNENYTYDEDDRNLFFDSIQIDTSHTLILKALPHKSSSLKLFVQKRGDTLSIDSQDPFEINGTINSTVIYRGPTKTNYRFLNKNPIGIFEALDSLGNCSIDTLLTNKIDSTRSLTTLPLEKTIQVNRKNKRILIEVSFPWKIEIQPKKLEVAVDSVWTSIPFTMKPFSILLDVPELKPGKIRYRLDTLSFFNRSGYCVDSLEISKQDMEQPGSISGEITVKTLQPVVAELLDASRKSISISSGASFMFHVKPGKYFLQTFVDWNGDGRYTGGNKKLGRKAEPLFLYPNPIELKPGWDIENLKISSGY